MPPHNYRSRSSSSGASSPMNLYSPSTHCNARSASPPQPADIATLCSPSSASHAGDGHDDTTAPRVLLQPPPGLEKYAHLCSSHGITVKAAPVRPRLHTSTSVPSLQPHVSATQVGTHPVRLSATFKRSASTALAGTHNPVGADPRAETGPFPKPRALVLPMVKFGHTKPDGLGHIDIADSDLMHHQYGLSVFSGTQAQHAETPPTSSQRLAEGFMRLFFKKPAITFPTSLISSLRTLATRTPSSPTLWFPPSRKTPQAKVRGVWSYSSSEVCCDALHFLEHRRSHFALHTSTMSLPRNVTHPQSYFNGYTGT